MSHHSDDQLLQAGSDSFWEPGNFKRTTKRIEDGHKLCTDLQALIQERSEIEKTYAKNLRSWSKRWGEIIEKGPEYGTIEAAWKGILTEADRLSEVHLNMKDDLVGDVSNMIKTWQKDNYHKTMMHIKERKEMEDQFKKAQKPWAKHLAKVEKTKTEYHNACKMEKSASNLERNATGDSSLSPDQLKKLQDRVQKTKDEVQRLREKYEQALTEINKYNPVYIEDMSSVFIKCQEMEETRLRFFKNCLFAIHKALNISQNPSLPQIYEEFYHTINNADHQKDLKWWSNNHGVNMAMAWPAFVEYTEEFRDITKGTKSKESLPVAPITLINQRPVGDDLHDYPPPPSSAKSTKTSVSVRSSTAISSSSVNAAANRTSMATSNGSRKTEVNTVITSSSSHQTTTTNNGGAAVSSPTRSNGGAGITNGNGKAPENPFDEEEDWDENDAEATALVDNGEPGVPVKALYDYEGAESDELTFKQGEIFDKLEDEDEQGWCKGRKNGRVGLYPANYVEVVAT